jgi:hypothetical protein
VSREPPDWIALAHPYDHHLDAAQPMWVSAGPTGDPARLDVPIHKGMDVGIMVSGGIELQFGDLTLRPQAGDVWLGAMWEPHGWRVLEPGTTTVITCLLPEVIEGGIGGWGSPRLRKRKPSAPLVCGGVRMHAGAVPAPG